MVRKSTHPESPKTSQAGGEGEERLLSEIAAAAKQLNEAADEANRKIAELEQQLITSGVGVEVWDGELVNEQRMFQSRESQRTYGPEEPGLYVARLGYTKLGDKWVIAIHESWWIKDPQEETPDDPYPQLDDEQYIPLLKANRDLRILATPRIPELLESILEKLSSCTKTLKHAAGRFPKSGGAA